MEVKFAVVFLIMLIPLFYPFEVSGETCYCNSCGDCTLALSSDECSIVELSENLYEVKDSLCIEINKSKTFSCDNNIINADNDYETTGMKINANLVMVKDCSIEDFDYGIKDYAKSATLENIKLSNSQQALLIKNENRCKLRNVLIEDSKKALSLFSSDSCNFENLTIFNSNVSIELFSSKKNLFDGLTIMNSKNGFSLKENSVYNTINNSKFTNTTTAMFIDSDNIEITNTYFLNNEVAIHAISKQSSIHDSYFKDNTLAIYIDNSRQLKIFSNYFEGPTIIKMKGSFKSSIFNSIFNSTHPVYIEDNSRAFWNVSKKEEKNILGFKAFGGNYWTDPSDNGYSDICIDEDNNAICDEPYKINDNNKDFLPILIPPDTTSPEVYFSPPTPEPGSIIFSNNFTVSVSAEDKSGISIILLHLRGIDGSRRDFTCFNKKTCNTTFTHLEEGSYFVNATAYDAYKNKNSTETILIYIKEQRDTFSYEEFSRYFPLALIAALVAVIIKEVLDISITFLKRLE